MYKQATKLKLKFNTTKGMLSIEQIFDLNLTDLSNSIKAVKKVLKKTDDDELSFLEDAKIVDVENQLRFDILKDVYITKKKEMDELRTAADNKAYNQKIIDLIAKKQDNALESLPVEELEKLLRNK